MIDALLTDDEIDEFCTCSAARRDSAIEYQIQTADNTWKTVFYTHKDCPLHGLIRINKKGKQNDRT
jgi:hypothetical protein